MAAQPDYAHCSTLTVVPEVSLADQLPRLDAEAARAINAFLDARRRFGFRVNQCEFELSWQASAPSSSAVVAEVSCGHHRIAIALDGLAAIDPLLVGAPFDLLPVPLRNLVLQHRLAAFLSALPAGIGAAAEVRSVQWEVAERRGWVCELPFALRRIPDGPESRGLIGTDAPATLMWLHEQLPSVKCADDGVQSDLSLPLTVVLGSSTVEVAQLRSLGYADVVWIEDAVFARKGVKVRLHARPGHRAWEALLTRTALHVTGLCERDTSNEFNIGDHIMSAQLATLEATVLFDLGTLQVPAAQLERMQPGRTFELPLEATQARVNLRVAGQCIARGTLVVIGRRLGVRIEQVFLNPAPSATASA